MGRPCQGQGIKHEYEPEKYKGQSHKIMEGSERNKTQVICSETLFLCREGWLMLATLEKWLKKKKKEPIMNFQVLLQREALQGNFCATREIIF